MTKKSTALFAVSVAIILLVGAVGYIYYTQLRGAAPAILPPADNIANVIEQTPPAQQQQANSTGFPLKLPDNYSISVYAKGLGDPRVMTYDNSGRILVSAPSSGKVWALSPNASGEATAVPVITGLNKPHGLAYRCAGEPQVCKLYIAETDQLASYDYDEKTETATNKKKLLDLPSGGNHVTRTIMFMPYPDDSKMLISIGSTCNVCHEENPMRATIQVYDTATGKASEFAKGLRNSVFMAIHPVNGKIWATENGRDLLGDDLPPDEINIIEQGKNYGWPICYGQNIHDTNFDHNTYIRNPCMAPFETPSHIDLPAHSAPLGMAFVPEEGWPHDMWFNALVAYHGSWNRSVPTGYKIVRIKLDQDGNYLGTEDFITGWLQGNKALGRPVDILIQPGGTIYISDDKAGIVYKVKYTPPSSILPEQNDMIRVTSPKSGELVSSPLKITGEARGNWYFEASFPVVLQDAKGNVLAQGAAKALSEWMTTDYVPFEATLDYTNGSSQTGSLILKRDNPSGLPENDASIAIPVILK